MFKDTGKHPGSGAESKLLVQLNKLDWTDLKAWAGLSLLTSYKGGHPGWLALTIAVVEAGQKNDGFQQPCTLETRFM